MHIHSQKKKKKLWGVILMFAGGISLRLVKLSEQTDFCRQENSHLHLKGQKRADIWNMAAWFVVGKPSKTLKELFVLLTDVLLNTQRAQAASVLVKREEESGGKTVVRLYPRFNTARSSQHRLARCRIIIGHFIDPCGEMLFLDILHMRVRGRAQLPRSCWRFSVSCRFLFLFFSQLAGLFTQPLHLNSGADPLRWMRSRKARPFQTTRQSQMNRWSWSSSWVRQVSVSEYLTVFIRKEKLSNTGVKRESGQHRVYPTDWTSPELQGGVQDRHTRTRFCFCVRFSSDNKNTSTKVRKRKFQLLITSLTDPLWGRRQILSHRKHRSWTPRQ